MVPNILNSKRRKLEDSAESASSSRNPRNRSEVRSPTTPDRIVRVSGSKNQERDQLFGHDWMKIHQDHTRHKFIMDKFVSGFGALASSIQVEAIHMNRSSFVFQTNLQYFNLVAKAMEKKHNGNANLKVGWYGASKEEIIDIISNGFVQSSYHHGVQFSARDYPLDCLQTAIQDKDGVRYLLFCRVILGKVEVVTPSSGQFQPSSEDLDSGVDNLLSPRKYIVWSCHLNTHIFPEAIVSFRVSPHSERVEEYPTPTKHVNLSRISFDAVVARLSRNLPCHAIKLITEYHNDHKEGKITMKEFVRQMSEVTGNTELIATIKSISAQHNLAQRRLTEQ